MGKGTIAGAGRKRPQLNVEVDRLHPDPENPRLAAESQSTKEGDLLKILQRDFGIEELADSMRENGYFDEEPLVAIPRGISASLAKAGKDKASARHSEYDAFIRKESTHFTVVEGNRRLAAAKILLDQSLRATLNVKSWPPVSKKVRADLAKLPVIVYPGREEVVPYLGVRHIVGIQKWDMYARARYIAKMVDAGRPLKSIQDQIGDRRRSATMNYICYAILQQVGDEYDLDLAEAQKHFSLLLLALGQGNVKRFLGLPTRWADMKVKQPVAKKCLPNLRKLFSWIFGEGDVRPAISESRDITNYLTHVVSNRDAVSYLERTRRLEEAYDLSDGEEAMLLKYLAKANSKLQAALGFAHRHRKSEEVKDEVNKCVGVVTELAKAVKD